MIQMQRARESKGLSKAKTARRADLGEGTYGQIERGIRRPYPVELERIATALEWPTEQAAELLEECDGQ